MLSAPMPRAGAICNSSVTAEEAKLVRSLLADAGAGATYVTGPGTLPPVVAEIVAGVLMLSAD